MMSHANCRFMHRVLNHISTLRFYSGGRVRHSHLKARRLGGMSMQRLPDAKQGELLLCATKGRCSEVLQAPEASILRSKNILWPRPNKDEVVI